MFAFASNAARTLGRWWEEGPFSLILPGTPRLFAHRSPFERLRIFLFGYNLVIMTASFCLTQWLVDVMVLGAGYEFRSQLGKWSEGLLRYILWTAANFPLARRFRDRYYAELSLSGHLPGLAPALLFGRQIFWASLVANSIYPLFMAGFAYTSPIQSHPIANWLLGGIVFPNPHSMLDSVQQLLHLAAVSLFRAGAVTYALFSGVRVTDAVGRLILAYAIGGVLLFSFYKIGAERGQMAARTIAHGREMRYWERHRIVREGLDMVERTVVWAAFAAGERRGAFVLKTRLDTFRARMEQEARVREAIARSTVLAFSMLLFLLPYYAVCIGGAWFFLHLTRRRTQWFG